MGFSVFTPPATITTQVENFKKDLLQTLDSIYKQVDHQVNHPDNDFFSLNDESTKYTQDFFKDPTCYNLLLEPPPEEYHVPINEDCDLNFAVILSDLKNKLKESGLATFMSCNRQELNEGPREAYSNCVTPIMLCNEKYDDDYGISNEIVLTVAVYAGNKPTLKSQEFQVLGSQPLTSLRDEIYCLTDQLFNKEQEFDYSKIIPTKKCIRGSGSASFFIEGVFYNDLGAKDAIDYSATIIDWIHHLDPAEQPFSGMVTSKDMADVTFDQLQLKMNHPYAFFHCGDCEHMIIFKDIRLIHPQDNHNPSSYPICTFFAKLKRKKCRICDVLPGFLFTVDDKLAPENPCLFCSECFNLLHLDDGGRLMYNDFKFYTYWHE